jgi:hypothetical protein
MSDWREAFEDAKRLFFLSVGISNSGGRRFRPELAKVVAGEGWRLENSTATVVDHEGKWALRLAPDAGTGVAWLTDHNFSTGKIDFRLAAIEQQAGLLLQPLPAGEPDLFGFAFSFSDKAGATGIDLRVWLESNGERQEAHHSFPLKMRGEWIPMRIVVTRELLCLFVDGDHVPALKYIHGHPVERPARLGVWRGPAAEVLLTDLKLIETDEWNLK